jgi:hypothetical protein
MFSHNYLSRGYAYLRLKTTGLPEWARTVYNETAKVGYPLLRMHVNTQLESSFSREERRRIFTLNPQEKTAGKRRERTISNAI